MQPGTPAMGVGLHYGGTDRSMPVLDLALAAEQRGLDSIFLPEHTHIPVVRATPYPGGGPMPARYPRLWDPYLALAFVAARTGLVVGTCVGLPGGHDPIALAKAVATLDALSGGRFVMGVGFGWNVEEFEDHGFSGKVRHDVVIEKIRVMKALWSDDVASFEGEHVRLSPSWSWPKPAQRPHPPVLLGGRAVGVTFRRIADWADGWIPMSTGSLPTLEGDLARLRAAWAEKGRDSDPQVVVMQSPRPPAELRDLLAGYRELGVCRVLIDVPTATAAEVLPLLDATVAAIG
ncbi:LLM class F420-dependent oxidoreductase [Frankia sp. CNm7]|uniref:LLM class F420-dependent oxidoreductase n=2 Tax=Frankia nepalensis TaxID=1836974 RepID=A0A937USQ8_9ACTN|nr:LLM class F420-dependent oxidoreductase [Frankia nepalensis]MBL7515856.1 LLM class F420-dependent oxidoreductase [Frankia nepalensis]MBL7521438.1 LLM class F420-dependent oxidoreductase [Frankia nepalensis]MBL7629146.1 LLM class F420-dependent oxidoreductase [Frankia nepalensis]